MSKAIEPLVSVVIPFYNEEQFLQETIESVIRQDYTRWEILLVDDNGSEKCTLLAKSYALQLPEKIVYAEHMNHANRGPAASRNLGIAKSKGDLIAFVDADDVWLPQKLKEQVEIFLKFPQVSMVCEASKYWYSWEGSDNQDTDIFVGVSPNQLYVPPALAIQLYPLGTGAAPCPSSIVIRKEALVRNGNFEESFIGFSQAYEDQAFLSKIYLNETVYVSGACNNLYRQRQGSAMHRMLAGGNYTKARNYFLQWLKIYIKENNIKNAEVKKLVRKAIYQLHTPYLYSIPGRFYRKVKALIRYVRTAQSQT